MTTTSEKHEWLIDSRDPEQWGRHRNTVLYLDGVQQSNVIAASPDRILRWAYDTESKLIRDADGRPSTEVVYGDVVLKERKS